METFILLENVAFYANHGVFRQENTVGNNFLINLKIKTISTDPNLTDDIDDTVSYADVFNIVKQEMAIPSKLLEHVGARIIKKLRDFSSKIGEIELKISKQNPPLGGQVQYASIILIDKK